MDLTCLECGGKDRVIPNPRKCCQCGKSFEFKMGLEELDKCSNMIINHWGNSQLNFPNNN